MEKIAVFANFLKASWILPNHEMSFPGWRKYFADSSISVTLKVSLSLATLFDKIRKRYLHGDVSQKKCQETTSKKVINWIKVVLKCSRIARKTPMRPAFQYCSKKAASKNELALHLPWKKKIKASLKVSLMSRKRNLPTLHSSFFHTRNFFPVCIFFSIDWSNSSMSFTNLDSFLTVHISPKNVVRWSDYGWLSNQRKKFFPCHCQLCFDIFRKNRLVK